MTGGEAKNVIKGMGETGILEGFKAMALLSKRFDSRTSASLLQAYLEVVAPTTLKGNDVIPGINRWETRVQLLRGRHDEELREQEEATAKILGMSVAELRKLVALKTWGRSHTC